VCYNWVATQVVNKETKKMISREDEKDPKKRILTACVKMFIEKGFKETTMLDIINYADVSAGTFQNIFKTKDGVLLELVKFMFSNQFNIAKNIAKDCDNPIIIYAIETTIQLSIVEFNENLREIYIEAYTQQDLSEFICKLTALELQKIFSSYNKSWVESDFYEADIGTSGMMRSFMAHHCDMYFPLKRKIEKFLSMAFDVYHIPKSEQKTAIDFIMSLDLTKIANDVIKELFKMLEINFNFQFNN